MIVRAGGPIAWASVCQERTSRSSCEAEVRAPEECTKEVLSVRLRGKDIGLTIHHIPGVINCADIFTKELKDTTHFCLLRDSFMMDKAKFLSMT